jgi:glycerol-3-phosphate acyltransferase PlsY
MVPEIPLVVVASYFLGAVPVGILAGKACAGVDPREAGSRNIGFTNVLRVAGKVAGLVTLAGDMGKGAVAVLGARVLLGPSANGWELAVAAAAVLGHIFPVFLHFKGGKGVATALGVLLALDWVVGGCLVVGWLVSAILWRISSVAALVAFGMLPGVAWFIRPQTPFVLFSLILTALIVYRHVENIQRLLAGREPKWGHRLNS